ncbi:transposase [Enterococcus faecalis]
MVKYGPLFKRKVIEEYLLNKPSYSKLSKKFKVSQSHIYEWIRLYEDRGEQFFKWKGHQKYWGTWNKTLANRLNCRI